MINIKKFINNMRKKSFTRISIKAEKIILEDLGETSICYDDEGRMHEYTEQDIWEYCQKIIERNK